MVGSHSEGSCPSPGLLWLSEGVTVLGAGGATRAGTADCLAGDQPGAGSSVQGLRQTSANGHAAPSSALPSPVLPGKSGKGALCPAVSCTFLLVRLCERSLPYVRLLCL